MSLVDGPTSDTKGSMFRDQKTYQEISSGTSNDLEAFRDRRALSGFRSKLSILALLGCSILLVSYLRDCLPEQGGPEQDATYPDFNIVKYSSITAGAASSAVALLEDFQVYQPVLTPTGVTDDTTLDNGSENTTAIGQTATSSNCEVVLMVHSFGYSYGVPFVGNYVPPSCKFNRVSMNFTVESRGRQFDRLAIMYFNDTEVWRTSTAEPTSTGIRWEYIKDMTPYMYFWDSPQKLIFDLGNIIDSTYTGYYNTTLTATFFNAQDTVDPADLIVPISARHGAASAASMFVVPSDNATNTISFPRNVNRAVFSVSACGQATEEFWWSNVLQSDINTFLPYDGTLYGYSPFREVQVLIDGHLAGVQWPFPVIFTGGVVPGLWRPIVGLDAFDLREHEIDISPFLPILCDGQEHTFEIRVAGINDNGGGSGTITETVGASWYVTGKIFIWLDANSASITTGTSPISFLPSPAISLSQSHTTDSTGANVTLTYTANVARSLSISSTVKSATGTKIHTWSQQLSVTNYAQYTDYGAIQVNSQSTTGLDTSLVGGTTYYKSSYNYPLYANTSYIIDPISGNYSIGASLQRGLTLQIQGTPVFPTGLQPFANLPKAASLISGLDGSLLTTTQNGTASYFASPSAGTSSSFGTTSQVFSFGGFDVNPGAGDTELYFRDVEAVNATVVRDFERLVGSEVANEAAAAAPAGMEQKGDSGVASPKAALGRGPGQAKLVLVQAGGN